MPKYSVEYYFAETQTDEVEADSAEAAQQQKLDELAYEHQVIGRPTDVIFGVRSVEEIEEEEVNIEREA